MAILDLGELFGSVDSDSAPAHGQLGRVLEVGAGLAGGVAPPALGGRGYYLRKKIEILSAKSCDLVHILYCNCQYNSTTVPGKRALVRVTH